MASVQRLKKTWRSLPSKYRLLFKDLERLMDHHRNYAAYRTKLSNVRLPALPYFGLYLRDITFIDVGNKNNRSSDLVSMDKITMIHEVVDDMRRFQVTPYNLRKVPQIYHFCLNVSPLSDDALDRHSVLCEERVNVL